jgi:hypothetical protein
MDSESAAAAAWFISNRSVGRCRGSGGRRGEKFKKPALISVADPDPGSGVGKKSGSESGMNNPDHISESLETIFWVNILRSFAADPG